MDSELKTELTALASSYTINLLAHYGNAPNHQHQGAIAQIISGFVSILDVSNKKVAYPLFCGGGKSTCIRGFLKVLHDLNFDYSVG